MARVLFDELARGGVRDAVLAPGSRSAPLALALGDQDLIRVHVRIDERSAGFLALGLAMGRGAPVAVVCTSGTAVANLLPAALEARYAGVPLLLLTADRPPELRGIGANQTIEQAGLFASAVRVSVELGVPEARPGAVRYWRSVVRRALAAAGRPEDSAPVHLNLAFRDPLVPDGTEDWMEPLDPPSPPPGRGWSAYGEPGPELADILGGDPPERGAVLAGHGGRPGQTRELAERLGWPLIAEPTANVGPDAATAAPLLLADAEFAAAHRPEVLITVGKPGLSRSVLAWAASARRHLVVDPRREWADPTRTAELVLPGLPSARRRAAGDWLASWQAAGRAARAAVDAVLDPAGLTEPRLARDLVAALPTGATLFVGNSRPIRDVEAYAVPRDDLTVRANRGVSGIDGLVSTALGLAAAGGRTVALLGDLAFLHDHNGLLIAPGEPRPDLTIVVSDNDGGGIFSTLEAAGRPGFERFFGTPHGLDLAAVAEAAGWPCRAVEAPADLADALTGSGPRVVLARSDRAATATLHRSLQAAVSAALRRG